MDHKFSEHYYGLPLKHDYGELGRVPLIVKRKERILKYWCKIECSFDILLNNAYINETRILDNDIRTFRINYWASEVKYMLNPLGFAYLWDSERHPFATAESQYLQLWSSNLNTMSKLSTHKTFKTEFSIEKYFTCIINERQPYMHY